MSLLARQSMLFVIKSYRLFNLIYALILIDLSSDKIYSKVWKNHIVIEEILANVINDSLAK